MNKMNKISLFILLAVFATSCGAKKKLQRDLDSANLSLTEARQNLADCKKSLNERDLQIVQLKSDVETRNVDIKSKKDNIEDLKAQIKDLKFQREQQLQQVGDLTVLSQTANENMGQTIKQLEGKDKYIRHLQNAKSKADSLNLALAVNLTSSLKDGIDDEDVEVKVDKTVVYINLSDKMMYNSGSSNLTPRAKEVLEKIASIVKSRPDLDIMVEGYTDNQPIKTACIEDNWDLSVKRATSVIRLLQDKYKVDPDHLIAAGRGEYNTLADNSTAAGRAANRRTRIILLPRLNQFYDLLNPANAPK